MSNYQPNNIAINVHNSVVPIVTEALKLDVAELYNKSSSNEEFNINDDELRLNNFF